MKFDKITKCQPLMWGLAITFWVILAVIVLLGYLFIPNSFM